jgi:hypothetical protein
VGFVGLAITATVWCAVHWTGGLLPQSLHFPP